MTTLKRNIDSLVAFLGAEHPEVLHAYDESQRAKIVNGGAPRPLRTAPAQLSADTCGRLINSNTGHVVQLVSRRSEKQEVDLTALAEELEGNPEFSPDDIRTLRRMALKERLISEGYRPAEVSHRLKWFDRMNRR